MSLNGFTLNSIALNSSTPVANVLYTGAGSLCAVAQQVVVSGIGNVCVLVQDVTFLITGYGSLCAIVQTVQTQQQHQLVAIAQVVQSQQFLTWLQRNGWYAQIVIAGQLIPDNQVTGNISVTHQEGEASIASFTLWPGVGQQLLDNYEAIPVQIYVTTRNIGQTLVFGGQITKPSANILTRKTTYECSTVRQNQINNSVSLTNALSSIGYWTTEVFGNINHVLYNGVYKELENRLTTVPYTVDFDPYGNWHYTPLLAKSSYDVMFVDDQVYRENNRDPEIIKSIWSRMTNYITIHAKYDFQRAYQRELGFQWIAPFANNTCDFLEKGYTVTPRSLIEQAVKSAGWPVTKQGISYTPVLASGFYNCGSGQIVGYTTSTDSFQNVPATDALGNQQTAMVNGVSTNLYQSVLTSSTDYANLLCFGASWSAATRFTQNIQEFYTMVVYASQSTTYYGQQQKFDNVSVTSAFNAAQWEKFKDYKPFPIGALGLPEFNYNTNSNGIDTYADIDTYLPDFTASQTLALNRAATDIIKAHRDNKVIFNTFLHPELSTIQTVYLNCTRIQAKGKVFNIAHTMNIETGEANTKTELVLSRALGSASADVLYPPARFEYIPPATTPVWEAYTAYEVGQTVQPPGLNGYWYSCTVLGISGSGPGWIIPPTHGVGDIFTDGTVTWKLAGLVTLDVGNVTLGSHYGVQQPPSTGTLVQPTWNGMVGNKYITKVTGADLTNTAKTTYPVQFIVDTPAIGETVRHNQVAVAPTAYYNVALQNDLLTVYYNKP